MMQQGDTIASGVMRRRNCAAQKAFAAAQFVSSLVAVYEQCPCNQDYLDNIMVPYKDIHGLDIAMDNLGIMKGLHALTDLHEIFPDDLLRECLLQLIPLLDESTKVPIWGVLHDNTQQVPCRKEFEVGETWCICAEESAYSTRYAPAQQQNDPSVPC